MTNERRMEINDIISTYLNRKYKQGWSTDDFYTLFKTTKEEGIMLLKWLFKNHRKIYYKLDSCYHYINGKYVKSQKLCDKLHEDWGSNGYLPYFSDKPDYYYIRY